MSKPMNTLVQNAMLSAAGNPEGSELARMKRNYRVSKGNIVRKNTLVLTTKAAVDTAFGDVAVVLIPNADGEFIRTAVQKDSFELINAEPTKSEGDEAAEPAAEAS